MSKPIVADMRYDFRGGRNTAISSDLLNPNELVDCTNARLNESYGGFSRRLGSQRIHPDVFPASVMGVTQWDTLSGKQVVVISNGDLYYRNGYDFGAPFTKVSTAGTQRSTAAQGVAAGWTNTTSVLSGTVGFDSTEVTGERPIVTVGDPAVGDNDDAADDLYNLQFDVTADGTAMSGTYAALDSIVMVEANINGAGFNDVAGPYTASASIGTSQTQHYSIAITASGVVTDLQIRLKLRFRVVGLASGTGIGTVDVIQSGSTGYPVTWVTGAARFSLTEPAIFAPFRKSTAGAPLVLYIASGGHYFSWDGDDTVTQLDPTNNAPLTTAIISYHTRMFAMTASSNAPGQFPKTIFWSKLGDPENFTTGDKSMGGSAVTDFLTGQQLVALEVIGSSLLMGTNDSVMRFTGHASDDIVISQDTEGINAEVGPVGLLALKRYENVAAMLSDRGAYVITETYAEPSGEQLNPDWNALDADNLDRTCIEYNRSSKDLLFAVPGASDGGYPKTVFAQSVRLQSWQGPWSYPFSITYLCKYFDEDGIPSILAGSTDGYVRQLHVGTKDDVLSDGTGGTIPVMTVEMPIIQFGVPGQKKSLKRIMIQADIPAGGILKVKTSFDGDAFTTVDIPSEGNGLRNYSTDLDGQGFRLRLQFVNESNVDINVNGYTLEAWNLLRTS